MRKSIFKISFLILAILSIFTLAGCIDIFDNVDSETPPPTINNSVAITSSTFEINGDNLYIKVANATTAFSFVDNITVGRGGTYKLYTTSQKTQELSVSSVSLGVGDNSFYIEVTNGSNVKGYNATVRRRPIYQVSFNCDTQTIPTQNIEEDNYATMPTTTPTKTGYTFGGWDFNFGSTKITSNITIDMNAWIANTYTVKFNANGGSGLMVNQYFTYGVAQNLFENKYSKIGYTFGGWSYNSNVYADLESVINLTPDVDGEIILTAIWNVNSYTLTLNSDNLDAGTITGASTYAYNTSVTISANPNSGYIFLGWYNTDDELLTTEPDGVTASTSYTFNMPNENVVITAKWRIDIPTYTLTLNTNIASAGTVTGAGEYNYNERVTIMATTNDGYTFLGWYNADDELLTTESDGITPSNSYTFDMPETDIIITAKWEEIPEHEHVYLCSNEALCTVCYELDLTKCGGRYGYNELSNLPNGEKMQMLYNDADEKIIEFFNNDTLDIEIEGNRAIASVNYLRYGLSEDEALTVWTTYRNDNPQYYFISRTLSYSSAQIKFLIDKEYVLADTRREINELIEEGVKNHIFETDSIYSIALQLHDTMIDNMSYAYEPDSNIPSNAVWAHNIVGYFDGKSGVCESYAKVFQLMLNIYGIDNVFVAGTAGVERHAWNMLKLDDGNWYWCDLTWDDTPNFAWGISHTYFCKNDNEIVYDDVKFIDSHIPDSQTVGINYLYSLPERSAIEYNNAPSLEISETFTVDDYVYEVVGYNKVELKEILSLVYEVEIFNTVEYDGIIYDIISIGRNEGNVYGQVIGIMVTSVTINKNLINIDPYAFQYTFYLEDIYYDGTEAEWNEIVKGQGWDENSNSYTLHFMD